MTTNEFIDQDASIGMMGLFRVYDEDIIVGIGDPKANLGKKEIDNEVHFYLRTIKKEAYHSILDVRRIYRSTKDQREWIHGDLSKQVIKSYALIASDPFTYLLSSLAIKLKGLYMPSKLFKDFDSALKWTIEQKKSMQIPSVKRAS